jgi:prepilin-type N-terminal cleavage/methylation domain-containing protein
LSKARTSRRGFTLIELLIVVGIIVILVAVLALAIMPYFSKAQERTTRELMTQVGEQLASERNLLSVPQMQRDAGPLSSQISRDPKIASAQMIVFYYAPSQRVREQATVYKGSANAEPRIDPKLWVEFMTTENTSPDMPSLCDAWSTPLWYLYDKGSNTHILRSAGEDLQWDTDDDLAYSSGKGSVGLWNEMKKQS